MAGRVSQHEEGIELAGSSIFGVHGSGLQLHDHARLCSGCEVKKAMGSEELTERLRAISAKGFSADELKHVASHSHKATSLAYMKIWACELAISELSGKEHASALNYTSRETV